MGTLAGKTEMRCGKYVMVKQGDIVGHAKAFGLPLTNDGGSGGGGGRSIVLWKSFYWWQYLVISQKKTSEFPPLQ